MLAPVCRLIVVIAAWLVPEMDRRSWRREWHAELAHAHQRLARGQAGLGPRLALAWRCRAALAHAAWLRIEALRVSTPQYDVRDAWRAVVRRPGPAAIAVVTFALGIGASSAMFAIVYKAILAPLPYPHAARLALVREIAPPPAGAFTDLSYPDYTDWLREARTVESAAAYAQGDVTVLGEDQAERLRGAIVSAAFFPILGASASAGRLLQDADEIDGAEPAAVVSEAFARRHLSRTNGVGSLMTFNGRERRVVGVVASDPLAELNGFAADVWLPITRQARPFLNRGNRFLQVFARLRPGVAPEQATAELDAVMARLALAYPETNAKRRGRVDLLQPLVAAPARSALLLVSGVVAALLLVACANLASLATAAALARTAEFDVRLALGATSGRLVRQVLAESTLVAVAGGVAALLTLNWTLNLIVARMPASVPRSAAVALDWRVVAFTAAASIGAGLLSGWPVAWHVRRRARARGAGDSLRATPRLGARRLLVAAQLALSIAMLVPASLLAVSYLRLERLETGFDAGHVVTLQLSLPPAYRDQARARQFVRDAVAVLSAVDGVEHAALMGPIPFSGNRNGYQAQIEGRPVDPSAAYSDRYLVTPGALAALRLRLVGGRFLDDRDRAASERVAVVDDSFVRRHFADGPAIGQRIRLENNDWLRIVGVVAHVKHLGFDETPRTQVYLPYDYDPVNWLNVVARGRDREPSIGALGEAIRRVDPAVPVYEAASLADLMNRSTAARRLAMQLVATLGLLALVVAGVGLYGAVAFAASRRTRELGVRLALGARPIDVARLVAADGVRLAAVGTACGVPLAAVAVALIRSRLFNTTALDFGPYAVVVFGLVLTALAASAAPARRAARLDPTDALRRDS